MCVDGKDEDAVCRRLIWIEMLLYILWLAFACITVVISLYRTRINCTFVVQKGIFCHLVFERKEGAISYL